MQDCVWMDLNQGWIIAGCDAKRGECAHAWEMRIGWLDGPGEGL